MVSSAVMKPRIHFCWCKSVLGLTNWATAAALGELCRVFLARAKLMSVVDSGVAPLLYRIRAVLSVDPVAGSCSVTSACHFAMVALRRIWLRLKADQTRKDQAPGATFLKFVVGPKTGQVPSITSSLVMVAMLTSLGTGAIINGARLLLCRIAMVDARSAPRYDVLTKMGFVIWERGPISQRVASCLLLLMAT